MARHQRLLGIFVSLFLLSVGLTLLANLLVTDQRALPVSITLPILVAGATASSRRTSWLGVNRTDRQILLSPVGHFFFASAVLLPPFALPFVALVVPIEQRTPSTWLIRFQRLLTMTTTSLAFWLVINNGSLGHQLTQIQVVACLAAMATHVLTDAFVVTVVMGLTNKPSVMKSSHWTRDSLLRETAEVSIGCIGAIFAVTNPLLLLLVMAPCYLTFDHLRVNQSAQLSKRDTRTGLLNSFGLTEFVNHEFERAKRHSTDLCLVILDLDFLRDVNNNYGHQIGDLAINAVAQQIATSTRSIDGTARIGGEEFVVVLPDTDLVGATTVAERIRVGIEEMRLPTIHGELRVTISGGIAIRNHNESYAELFDRADAALYESKHLGRNRVNCAIQSDFEVCKNQV